MLIKWNQPPIWQTILKINEKNIIAIRYRRHTSDIPPSKMEKWIGHWLHALRAMCNGPKWKILP